MENEKLKSCISNVYEMRDEMQNSIKNAERVMEEQKILADLIKHSKHKKRFEDLLKGFEDDKVGYQNQIANLKEKTAYANAIIGIYEAGHKPEATEKDKANALLLEQVVTTMCLLLSIVPTETEQRIKAEQEQATIDKAVEETKTEVVQ